MGGEKPVEGIIVATWKPTGAVDHRFVYGHILKMKKGSTRRNPIFWITGKGKLPGPMLRYDFQRANATQPPNRARVV
jgi:hypothetical protein